MTKSLNDVCGWEWPLPCVSTAYFSGQFPKSLHGRDHLSGRVLGRVRGGLFRVKWDHLKTPVTLHEKFLALAEADAPATPLPGRGR